MGLEGPDNFFWSVSGLLLIVMIMGRIVATTNLCRERRLSVRTKEIGSESSDEDKPLSKKKSFNETEVEGIVAMMKSHSLSIRRKYGVARKARMKAARMKAATTSR